MHGDEIRKRVRERLAEQRLVVRSLLAMREQLPGSLFARYAECGKESCSCRTGRKHGPYYVISQRSGGKGAFAYLETGRVADARLLVARSRAFRDGLRRLRRVNLELVGLLRRYQRAMTEKGGLRLGLPAARQP
jgi:hypothetical protein